MACRQSSLGYTSTHPAGRGPRAVLLGTQAIALLGILVGLSGCGEIDAQARNAEGVRLFEQARYPEATREFQEAVYDDPVRRQRLL